MLNYFTASNTFRGELRNCLSNDNHGEVEHRVNEAGDAFEVDEDGNPIPVRSEDLSCVYDIRSPNKNANLNDNYLYDTVAVGNAQNSPVFVLWRSKLEISQVRIVMDDFV